MPVDALDEHITQIGAICPAAETETLERFRSHAADADIVGLGEATHGSRELFELKHRLVRTLVADCGFRTIAVETDFANTLSVEEFVRRGTGTAADALDDIILWIWKVEAVLDLLEWLRSFNDGRPLEDRVRLHGVSLSDPDRPASRLLTVLQESHALEIPRDLTTLADTDIPGDEDDRTAFLEMGATVAETVREYLDDHRSAYVDEHSTRAWTIARHLCRHLEQTCSWNQTRLSTQGFDPDAFEQRDRYMAENTTWCLDTDHGEGVVVWAHNTHVKRGSFDMAYDWATGATLGEYLHREHGSGYRPYATTFPRGQFRAVAETTEADGTRVFEISEPAPASLAEKITATAAVPSEKSRGTAFFFDIETASTDQRLDSWFGRVRHVLGASALINPDDDRDQWYIETDIPASFDGLLFVPESSPTHRLDSHC